MARSPRAARPGAATITIEGALIGAAMVSRIAAQPDDEKTRAAYGIPKGLGLREEISRYFRIGQAVFGEFSASPQPSGARTTGFTEAFLSQALGFTDIARRGTRQLGERAFPVTLEALGGRVPVLVVPPEDDLDRASEHLGLPLRSRNGDPVPGDHRRRSAASALQEWLNANEEAVWGLACNGERLRLLRRNASLTRPAYIEVDLRRIFEGEAFADFTALWLLLHARSFGAPGSPPLESRLEAWREAGSREGIAARERLREGVEAALLALGSGFLADPANAGLSARLEPGALPLPEFFGQLLRLVYRLIFLLTAEERGLLHPPDAAADARRLYEEGYSLGRLRERAVRRAARDRHHDAWSGLLIVFSALARGEKRLGLPALDGLFAAGTIPDLEALRLSNQSLLEAIHRLAWLREGGALVPVNWRDMETEELGSVYESLLELTPRLADDGRALAFANGAEQKGNARKTTGSYYTPAALVQALLDSALDPVLDRVEAEAEDPAAALLGVTVLDPACGSGHFLLAAGRRVATRLASARSLGVASAEDYRHALRDVARSCLFGVDRNPMAVELTKVALWIETVDPGRPLGFLDANIRCGDSLLGLFDLNSLEEGIPDAAYKPLTGDDKATAKYYATRNRNEREGQGDLLLREGKLPAPALAAARAEARALPEDSPEEIAEKRRRFEQVQAAPLSFAWNEAADLYVAAFLLPKTGGAPALGREPTVPTTGDVRRVLASRQVHPPLVARAVDAARAARAFHWPLEFPEVMARGGFDVVLGNPPWERIKLQEQEFFAALDPEIAAAPNAAARGRLIAALAKAEPGTRERALHEAFETAKRLAEASSVFARESGRFPLTGRGDVNTYALFAELFSELASPRGHAGVIVPTGIATDATTAPFFAALIDGKQLARLVDFENRDAIFPAVHRSYKFSLLTIGREIGAAEFAFFLTDATQWAEPERRFTLSPADIARINPNTRTAPVFRARADADLTAKIYARVPVLIDEAKGKAGNPWGVSFARLFDMSNDSSLFRTAAQLHAAGFARDGTDWRNDTARYVPLYEAKMIHQFDHRWATYDGTEARDATAAEKQNPDFEPPPRYWVPEAEVAERLRAKSWPRGWLMGWRDICRSTDERTVIATAFPRVGVNHKTPLFFVEHPPRLAAALLANWLSLTLDFTARQKIGGTSLTYFYLKQFPILPPSAYTEADLAFIVPRVLELSYTSHAMAPFAHDLGYSGKEFGWDEERRALLRAELDAFHARKYGLTRDELRYILDPEDAMGAGYPSETFRVLKKNEKARFGEYRTARLVLAAWDGMETEWPAPALFRAGSS
ncbi:MAG: N-6 DNA methylase [Rhodospirillales bacterium]|nr:N-6 DNA methylase [Rhodospirillales bacterium]